MQLITQPQKARAVPRHPYGVVSIFRAYSVLANIYYNKFTKFDSLRNFVRQNDEYNTPISGFETAYFIKCACAFVVIYTRFVNAARVNYAIFLRIQPILSLLSSGNLAT